MSMKRFFALSAASLLLGAAGSAVAANHSTQNATARNVLPVLVQVDDQGRVTSMLPAYQLWPQSRRLLRQTLDAMITRPAQHGGHAISSQFVINLAMRATPRADGNYNVTFAYVSAQPVPYGSWHWYNNGHRLALAGQNGLFRPPHRSFRSVPGHVVYHAGTNHLSTSNGSHNTPSKP